MKKILILTVLYGRGHESVAKSLQEFFEETKNEVVITNTHRKYYPFLAKVLEKLYLNIMSNWFFNFGYLKMHQAGQITSSEKNPINWLKGSTEREIKEVNPDIVINTFPCYGKTDNPVPQVIFITDYYAVRAWIHSCYQTFFVAHELTKQQIIRDYGIDSSKIIVTGIPVKQKFHKQLNIPDWKIKNHIPEDKKVVLITYGADGKVSLKKVITNLQKLNDNHIYLIVCGKNQKLYEKISSVFANKNNFKIYPFINNIEELMKVSSFMVTKAGGSSVAEAITVGTPIVLNQDESTEFPEGFNIKFARETKIGIISNNQDLICDINELANNDERLKKLTANIANVKINDQAEIISTYFDNPKNLKRA